MSGAGPTVAGVVSGCSRTVDLTVVGTSSRRPARADSPIITCCACCDPIHAISSRLAVNAPATAPIGVGRIHATDQTCRDPGPARRADARASGKLAPHSAAGGSTTHIARRKSSRKFNQMSSEMAGLIGQYGNDSASSCAVHATAATTSSWHQPKAARGFDLFRQHRSDAAADAETDQKHREDERERIDGRAEEQAEQTASKSPRRRARRTPTARSRGTRPIVSNDVGDDADGDAAQRRNGQS